jgi:hypothetical protein
VCVCVRERERERERERKGWRESATFSAPCDSTSISDVWSRRREKVEAKVTKDLTFL